jgi:signal transduction histidine kinase
MSLKRRLSVSIVALVVALVGLVSAGYLRYLLGMQLQTALEQAERAAEQVQAATQRSIEEQTQAGSFVPAGPEERRAFWRQAVRDDARLRLRERLGLELGSSAAIAEIAVTDEDRRILVATTQGRQWPQRAPLEELVQAGLVDQVRAVFAPQRDYEVSRALAHEGRAVLVVRVAASTALLRRQLEPLVVELGAAAMFSLLAATVLAVVFSRIAFRPLDALGQAIDRMTRGEFTAAPPAGEAGGDEYAAISSKLSLLGRQFRDAQEGASSLRGNLEQLVRKLEGAVLLFDAESRLVLANAEAESFLGLSRGQLMGRRLGEIFASETEVGALVQSAAQLRQPIYERLVAPAGALVSVEMMEEAGRAGTLILLRDAETRRQIQKQVAVSDRVAAIGRLTSGVAHEIKNPLNGITLYLDLLKNRLTASEGKAPPELDVIVREVARLDRVVKTFLDFTRPLDLQLTDVRPGELLEEVAALARPEAVNHKVEIQVENGCPDATIRADRDLVQQVVLNLAVNGIQAMPDGGALRVSVMQAGADVELAVTDQGLGIPPEAREKIFRLYFTTKKNGSGIGLAMAFRVVQMHGGTIDFSSEVGRGTTFRVRFPAVEAK